MTEKQPTAEDIAAQALGLKTRPDHKRKPQTTAAAKSSKETSSSAHTSEPLSMDWTSADSHNGTSAAATRATVNSWCLFALAAAAAVGSVAFLSSGLAVVAAVLYLGSTVADASASQLTAAAVQSGLLRSIRDDQRLSARYRDQSLRHQVPQLLNAPIERR